MRVSQDPKPFYANESYDVTATGGTPPYTFAAEPSPPNPPGVQVSAQSSSATVTVPEETSSGTQVLIRVTDRSDPPQVRVVTNNVI